MPFEIPANWCWTTLGEVFTLKAGKNITAKEISDKQDTIYPFPCYGGNGLRGYVSSYNRTGRYPLIGRQGALCGNINVADGLFYATEHAVVVESYCNIDVDWAVYALIYLNLNQYATSTAQPGLSVATINEVLLPVPPIDEQKRIANEIEKWFDLIKEIESGKVELKSYIKQTKSKILDLAISGKLVPQDPNDEPAIELLKRINPGFEPCDNSHYGNLPFEVPDGWCWATLGSIGKWQSGATPSRMRKDYYGGDIPWLKTGDLNDWYITDIPEYITQQALNETSVKLNPAGSILIAMYGATIGKIGILTMPATTNQACCACISHNGIEQMYLFYYLLSHKGEFVRQGGGGAQPNISKEKIVETLIPIPPLSEQLRIIKAIEAIFNQIDNITAEIS